MRRGAPLPPSHSPRAQAHPAPLLAGHCLRATRAKAYGLPSDTECEGGLPCPPRTPPAAAASVLHRPVFGRWRCSPLGLCSALPALVRRGFAARGVTIANRSVLRVPALDQRNLVKPFRAAARFITFAGGVFAPVGRMGVGVWLAGALPPACVGDAPASARKRALPPPPPYGLVLRAPSRPAGARPSYVGATRATSGTLDYSRGRRGLHDEPLCYTIPRPTPADGISSRTFPDNRLTKHTKSGALPPNPWCVNSWYRLLRFWRILRVSTPSSALNFHKLC